MCPLTIDIANFENQAITTPKKIVDIVPILTWRIASSGSSVDRFDRNELGFLSVYNQTRQVWVDRWGDDVNLFRTIYSFNDIFILYGTSTSAISELNWVANKDVLDFNDVAILPELHTLRLSQRADPLLNPDRIPIIAPNLKSVTFFNSNVVQPLSLFDSLLDLEVIDAFNTDLFGTGNIQNLTKLRTIRLNGTNLTQSDIDDLVSKLYQAGNNFTASGKFLLLRQNSGVLASGTINDPVTANTGQGWISGLINEFGWTVSQS